ncbi:1-acyl-sn-glycerol-3-phosphate acyltransferase [Treponema socranskii]|uniref:lysophospholipid acyltransferase family protein n=1 Tax=Treponema socranskii TaxID=53419 RepID=UPI003D8F74DE
MSELINNKIDFDTSRSSDDLPPVKNPLLYVYGAIMKLCMYAFFGIGSVVLGLVVFPIERLLIHPKVRFQRAARATVSFMFRFFINVMRTVGVVRFRTADKEKLRSISSKIVVANHPSMLDVVFLISLIPNADCIVRGSLANSLYASVIRQLYVVNTLGYEEMFDLCKKSLATGTNLIVFPEGTRTPRNGTNTFKKGAARMALDMHCNILPVYIGGSDKYGLGKHDAFFSYARSGVYRYNVYMLDEIKIADYESLEPQIAAKRITKKIHQTIADKAMLVDNRLL